MPKKDTTPQPVPQPAPQPVQPPARQQGDDAPIALGITSLLIWLAMPIIGSIIGIVLAAVGLRESKKQQGRGYGLNLAALITNICLTIIQFVIGAVIVVLILLGIFSEPSDAPVHDDQSIPESSFDDRSGQLHT